jgi:hypothetical protein
MRRRWPLLLVAMLAVGLAPAAGDARERAETWKPSQKRAQRGCSAQPRRATRTRRRTLARRACLRWGAVVPGSRPGSGRPAPGPEAPVGATPPAVLPRSVSVRALEYSLTLSRTLVGAGEVNVEFNTVMAEDPHDLRLRDAAGGVRPLFGETPPGLVPPPRQSFPLAAGQYVLFCSVSGHEALGMRAGLTVE